MYTVRHSLENEEHHAHHHAHAGTPAARRRRRRGDVRLPAPREPRPAFPSCSSSTSGGTSTTGTPGSSTRWRPNGTSCWSISGAWAATTGTTPDNVEAMAADAVAFLAALGLDQVDLFGYSLGGFVAQEVALTHPALVRRLVLAGTGPKGAPGMERWSDDVVDAVVADETGPRRGPLRLLRADPHEPAGGPGVARPDLRLAGRPGRRGDARDEGRPVRGRPALGQAGLGRGAAAVRIIQPDARSCRATTTS